MLRNYQDLQVWKKAMDLAEEVYLVSSRFPKQETYGITGQLRRSVVSVPANIAEGAERPGPRQFVQFLGVASGSLAEAETLLMLASRLGFADSIRIQHLLDQAGDIGRMINGLKRSLRSVASG